MTSAEYSKAVILLLLIYCLMLPPLFLRVMVGPCFVVHYLVSSFAIISLGKKYSWLMYFSCRLMSFDS